MRLIGKKKPIIGWAGNTRSTIVIVHPFFPPFFLSCLLCCSIGFLHNKISLPQGHVKMMKSASGEQLSRSMKSGFSSTTPIIPARGAADVRRRRHYGQRVNRTGQQPQQQPTMGAPTNKPHLQRLEGSGSIAYGRRYASYHNDSDGALSLASSQPSTPSDFPLIFGVVIAACIHLCHSCQYHDQPKDERFFRMRVSTNLVAC